MADTGAIENPVFEPARRQVSNISNDNPCVITTTFAHGYTNTTRIKLYIPSGFPMRRLNYKHGIITVIDDTSFYFPYDTTDMDAFVDPDNNQAAQTLPFGEDTSTVAGAVRNTLPPI